MTDEEMTEEYLKETFGLYCPTDQERYQVEQAYLAGLKAGRPKWHKVADGDLPIDCWKRWRQRKHEKEQMEGK